MKFSEWQVAEVDRAAISRLEAGGFSPLTAAVLCSRGYTDLQAAKEFLSSDSELIDPYLLRDMDRAAARIRRAMAAKEKIAVFGDYDVDGITATTLLTDYLRGKGADCMPYIPSRLEEGYGLNYQAIETLDEEGVRLIVTVDCGVTAAEEAEECRRRGIDLCITDHHECKSELPDCIAVVDAHRKDDTYPHRNLSGVGVAFKVAAALEGNQKTVLERYCDLLCLGTIADVMKLSGENRVFVRKGIAAMQAPKRVGLRALMKECGCLGKTVNATTVGYSLAPRINAAGRMGQVNVALELFLTDDAERAARLAGQLCQMNRERQDVEAEIYRNAVSMLPKQEKHDAIVLANPDWHQGVVGIVASRLAEEYACPTFLVCPDGDGTKGKASSRSYGGFNLFAALEELAPLLESYGGHELAAGFTIRCDQIDAFREEISRLSREFSSAGLARNALEIDCAVSPELLTLSNVESLEELEPCGAGCARPVFCIYNAKIEQASEVGGGKHLRLRLSRDGVSLSAIFFSTTALTASVTVGDKVDVAFMVQPNEFRGTRSVQLNLVDIRQTREQRELSKNDRELYLSYRNSRLTPEQAGDLLPTRAEFVALWRYLVSHAENGCLTETCDCLARKVSRYAGTDCRPARTRICLEVFRELELLKLTEESKIFRILLTSDGKKVNLDRSGIIANLKNRHGEIS
ncbi:MAG: single-stranded-DNA-specific exonuclease RecJ [Clostridia bacterium]|nr:single-stranded-DNA-specific exonuclease RecJ [Clostridia bacterium]